MSDPLPAPSPSKVENPTVGPTPAPPPRPMPAPKNDRDPPDYQGLRERMAALLSGSILLITLLMLYNTFFQASLVSQANTASEVAFNHMKDIMLYGLALLGTVTGYYFGRVPAELHAQQAQRSAEAAQSDLKVSHADARAANTETNQNMARSLTVANISAEQLNTTQEKLAAAQDKQKQATLKLVSIQNLLHQASPQSDGANVTHRRSTDALDARSFQAVRAVATAETPIRQAQEEISALLEHLNS